MKVYNVTNDYEGCYYVRQLVPLREGGWWADKSSLSGTREDPMKMKNGALSSDVIVFHRPDGANKVAVMHALQEAGKKVVFDNDDTYKLDSGFDMTFFKGKRKRIAEVFNQNLNEAIKLADMVTSSTEFLAEEYRQLNDNVVVLPNCVDPFDWPEPKRNEGDKIRIGILGSVGVTGDYEVIKDVIEWIAKDDRFELVVFSYPPNNDDHKKARDIYKDHIEWWNDKVDVWQPFVDQINYQETLNDLELDIVLVPRKDNYFNKCKSNLKFLECSMLEIPVIASGFEDGNSPYEGKEDSKYMRIAKTKEDWYKHLEELSDKKTRRQLGKKAHDYVVDKYDIANNIHLWENAYKSLLDNK